MVFSSLEFLFWFLPFFLFVYYIAPDKFKNTVLFVSSLLFYLYGTLDCPVYFVLLLLSVAVNYFCGLAISRNKKTTKVFLIAGLIYNFSMLFTFKYADFFIGNVNSFTAAVGIKGDLPLTGLILPIGISFYTFQAVSYIADLYKGEIKPEKNILNFATYIVMFPQLIAGPIVRFSDVRSALNKRVHSKRKFICGIRYFVLGLGSKVLLANRLAGLWQGVGNIGYDSLSVPLAWFGIIGFSLQIYFDFYGYSLMAIGLGKMAGFNLPVNFETPYMARSMTEFWRRWHITLGTWFKKYVYIPLGGNRKGKTRTVLNLLCVWFLTGMWHGADWNFIIWGILLFVLIIIEKFGFINVLNRHSILSHIYMILIIPLSWLVFAVNKLSDVLVYAGRLIGIGGENVFAGDFIKYGKQYGIFVIVGIILCTGAAAYFYKRLKRKPYILSAVLLLIFAASVYCIFMGMNDPFLYFRF